MNGRLLIVVRPAENDNTFLVSLQNGIPDFRIRVPDFRIGAKNAQSAADALADDIYNELDGREDISGGEVT